MAAAAASLDCRPPRRGFVRRCRHRGDGPQAALALLLLCLRGLLSPAATQAAAAGPCAVPRRMNPNAASWTPNAGAASFVPSWGPAPAPAPAEEEPEAWDDEPDAVEEAEQAQAERVAKLAVPEPEVRPMTPREAPVPAPVPAPVVEPEPEPAEEEEEEEEEEDETTEWEEPPREEGDHRKHMNVVFIGHVDAGKSTLCGQIMWQSGNLDERTLQKYEDDAKSQNRESWKFAYAMDTNDEERAKGKTVEVGRAFFTTEHKRFTVLDAPGHKNFVPHMIGGASQADVGVLLIAARKGEFETGFEKGGQTREHIQLAKTAGVKQLVVVINKMDDPTVEWSEERYMECKKKLFPFLKASGFRPKKDCFWLPISALSGINIGADIPEGVCPWHEGKCLLTTLDELEPPERLLEYHVRMPITDKYNDMGVVIMGKVQAGLVKVGDKMVIAPIDLKCTVVEIEKHGEKSAFCEPGDNVKIKVGGIQDEWEQIESGFMLCPVKHPIPHSTTLDAEIEIIEYKSIICPGFSCVLHVHSIVEDATITHLIAIKDKKTGKPKKGAVKFVREGDTVFARVRVARPICVETFEEFDQFGRFMLRDEGKTLGMGIIKRIVDKKK